MLLSFRSIFVFLCVIASITTGFNGEVKKADRQELHQKVLTRIRKVEMETGRSNCLSCLIDPEVSMTGPVLNLRRRSFEPPKPHIAQQQLETSAQEYHSNIQDKYESPDAYYYYQNYYDEGAVASDIHTAAMTAEESGSYEYSYYYQYYYQYYYGDDKEEDGSVLEVKSFERPDCEYHR